MIRFQICIFDILNTATNSSLRSGCCCDSLSNLYLWHIKYSFKNEEQAYNWVVIRFQICIFDILNTANIKILVCAHSCDSLSNLYLWHIKYSGEAVVKLRREVVIRFQICIFDILNTAPFTIQPVSHSLWFAFKFVSLTY